MEHNNQKWSMIKTLVLLVFESYTHSEKNKMETFVIRQLHSYQVNLENCTELGTRYAERLIQKAKHVLKVRR